MKVIVTGGSGFVGSHTIPYLKEKGMKVFNFDLKTGYDIRRADCLESVIESGDKILHLAAVARFSEADDDPVNAYSTNIGGTAMVLKAAQEKGAERVVMASTGSVYMPVWSVPIREGHPISGNSHYGFSKAMGEKMLLLYKNIPYVILRYAHLYGKGKTHHGLVDGFMQRIERGLAPILYGGSQSNDFCYVKDIAAANYLALFTDHLNEAFNIGTGEELTTEYCVKVLCNVFGYDGKIEKREQRSVDANRFVYDTRKAERLLNFVFKYDFRSGLEDMIGVENER